MPVLGGDPDIVELVRRHEVDRVMLTPAFRESRCRVEVVCVLSEPGIHIDLVPSWSDVLGTRFEVNEMEGMSLLTMPRPRHTAFVAAFVMRTVSAVVRGSGAY